MPTMGQTKESKSWPTLWAEGVGKQIQAVRKSRGMTVQGLSQRCAELRHPIPRSTLSNIEGGRKEAIVVQEIVVIAEALDVPPVELLFPGLMSEQCEFLPGQFTTAWNALKRFTGEYDLGGLAPHSQREYNLSLMRELDRNAAQAMTAMNNRAVAQSSGDLARVEYEESRIETGRMHDEQLKAIIRAAGYNVGDDDE